MDKQATARGCYALLLGLFFGWLLSFPMYGPVMGAMAGARDVEPGSIVTTFLITHAAGLFGFGFLGSRLPLTWPWFVYGSLACLVLTLSFAALPPSWWSPAMGLLGLFASLPVIVWTRYFADSAPYAWRGRTIAVAQIGANLLLILVGLALGYVPPVAMLVISAAFLILAAASAVYLLRRPGGLPSAGLSPVPPAAHEAEAAPPLPLWQLICLIIFFFFGAGLVNQVVYPAQSGIATLPTALGLLAYIVFDALSGYAADRVDRRHVAVGGLVVLGLSLFIGASLSTAFGLHAAQFLVQAAYAPMDVFLWVTLADIAPRAKPTVYFGLGLGLNVFTIYAGSLAVGRLASMFPGSSGALIAGAALFLAVPLVALAPVRISPLRAVAPVAHGETSVLASFGLTYREREIALLLLDGASNDDIVARLSISPNTLKTHLRHIYQKTETGNRRELILKVTRRSEPAAAPKSVPKGAPKSGTKAG